MPFLKSKMIGKKNIFYYICLVYLLIIFEKINYLLFYINYLLLNMNYKFVKFI